MIYIKTLKEMIDLQELQLSWQQRRTTKVKFICSDCNQEASMQLRTIIEGKKNNLICKRCNAIKAAKKSSGFSNTWTDEHRKKRKETCLKKYGVEHNLQRKERTDWADTSHTVDAHNKRLNTSKQRFGENNYMNRQKFKKTCTERYGGPSPFYDESIKRKSCIGYVYKDIHFDSSWELAYWIWLTDNSKQFIYQPDFPTKYIDDYNIERTYKPDFLIEGTFYEIKGKQFFNKEGLPINPYKKETWNNKLKLMIDNNVKILTETDLKDALEYVKNKYGKTFLKDHKKAAQKERP